MPHLSWLFGWSVRLPTRAALWRAAAACAVVIVIGVMLYIAPGRNAPRSETAPVAMVAAIVGVVASMVVVDLRASYAVSSGSDHAFAL